MAFRLCFTFLCFLLFSCNPPQPSSSVLLQKADSIFQHHNYSDSGFTAIGRLLRNGNGNNAGLKLYYYNYASVYFNLYQKPATAMAYADSMLYQIKRSGDLETIRKEKARAYLRKADVFYATKQYKDCYYYYSLGSMQADKLTDSALNYEINEHLSHFLYEEESYDSAIFYFKQLLTSGSNYNKSYNQLIRDQGTLNSIGMSYLKGNKPERALAYFIQALESISRAERLQPLQQAFCRMASGVVYGNMAQAYQQSGQYDSAQALYKRSIAMNRQPHYAIESALITQHQLAVLYYEERNFPELYTTLQQMKAGLDTIHNKKVETQWNYLMSRYNAAISQPAAALNYLNRYIELEQELGTDKPVVVSNIFEELEMIQSNYDLKMSEKNSQMKGIFLVAAGFIVLLTLTIAVQFFTNLKKAKQNLHSLVALHEEIKIQKAGLEVKNNEKRHILHVVAHDLRNPLGAIKALAGLVEEDYKNEEANRENLALINTLCTDSNELIGSLLELAENDAVSYKFETVDVNRLLKPLLEVLQMKANEKRQRIVFTMAPGSALIRANALKINRLIGNLITNAIKFSPSGNPIEVTTHVYGGHVCIQVRDYGIGIPQRYHATLFDIFTSAKRSGTEGEKTFGLGLSICKQIVENHKGRIWFESVESKGTTFFIEFAKLEEPVSELNPV